MKQQRPLNVPWTLACILLVTITSLEFGTPLYAQTHQKKRSLQVRTIHNKRKLGSPTLLNALFPNVASVRRFLRKSRRENPATVSEMLVIEKVAEKDLIRSEHVILVPSSSGGGYTAIGLKRGRAIASLAQSRQDAARIFK